MEEQQRRQQGGDEEDGYDYDDDGGGGGGNDQEFQRFREEMKRRVQRRRVHRGTNGDFLSWPAADRAEFMRRMEGVFHRSPVYQENKSEIMRHLMKITGAMLRYSVGTLFTDYQDEFATQKDLALMLACGLLTPQADLKSAVHFLLHVWASDRYYIEHEMFLRDGQTGRALLLHQVMSRLFEPDEFQTTRADLQSLDEALLPPNYAYPSRVSRPPTVLVRKVQPQDAILAFASPPAAPQQSPPPPPVVEEEEEETEQRTKRQTRGLGRKRQSANSSSNSSSSGVKRGASKRRRKAPAPPPGSV